MFYVSILLFCNVLHFPYKISEGASRLNFFIYHYMDDNDIFLFCFRMAGTVLTS